MDRFLQEKSKLLKHDIPRSENINIKSDQNMQISKTQLTKDIEYEKLFDRQIMMEKDIIMKVETMRLMRQISLISNKALDEIIKSPTVDAVSAYINTISEQQEMIINELRAINDICIEYNKTADSIIKLEKIKINPMIRKQTKEAFLNDYNAAIFRKNQCLSKLISKDNIMKYLQDSQLIDCMYYDQIMGQIKKVVANDGEAIPDINPLFNIENFAKENNHILQQTLYNTMNDAFDYEQIKKMMNDLFLQVIDYNTFVANNAVANLKLPNANEVLSSKNIINTAVFNKQILSPIPKNTKKYAAL
jgi:hypothetical protein